RTRIAPGRRGRLRQRVEGELFDRSVDEPRDAHTEEADPRGEVERRDELLRGPGDVGGRVDRRGKGDRSGDRAEVGEPHLDGDRTSPQLPGTEASGDRVALAHELLVDAPTVDEVVAVGLLVAD